MAERPLLILPAPGEPVERRKKGGGGRRFHHPTRERQTARLSPRFEQLQRALEAKRARIQTEAHGLVPEEVVVFETIGTVDGFIRAVERLPGMEWLGEIEEEDIPPDDDFFSLDNEGQQRPDKPLRGRLFMVFTNQEALRQMLSLWEKWQVGQKLPHGLGRWKAVFEQLRDVRRWGIKDRLLDTGVLQDWQERVEHGEEVVPCEIELWHRKKSEQRQNARDRVAGLVTEQEGHIVDEAIIEEITYHALLVELPIGAIDPLLRSTENDTELVQCEQIQFFRASGQMAAILPEDVRGEEAEWLPSDMPSGDPVIALLDGLPLQAHQRLDGRLVVDDPDGVEDEYLANERRHGTAMASLIVHGDLGTNEESLSTPLYIRPILRPDDRDWRRPREESVPEDVLVVDLIHRSVRRLFEGDGDNPPTAPEVAVVNLSVGIRDRLFDGSLSPLACLLDWLSWQYQVLFVVSAGNHVEPIELDVARGSVPSLPAEELQQHVIRAIAADARHRRLLSPAEAVNILTIAALYEGGDEEPPPQWIYPYTNAYLPSPINAQGMGYRRAVKPELLAPGGRIVVQEAIGSASQSRLTTYNGTLAPGQLAAAPGRTAGDRNAIWYTRGTSVSAALTSRAAALLHDVLSELRGEPGGELVDEVPVAVWLKAMLAHGAEWKVAGETLEGVLRDEENSRQFKEYVTRLLGYGAIDVDRVRDCTPYRATALSGGSLSTGQSHIHRFPLPPSLSGQRGLRELVITLAWMSPINPRHQSWRRADLWFASPADPLRLSRREADWRAVQRGTLQHEIFKGEDAVVFVDGANVEIQVNCRADAGDLDDEVPYALIATLSVAEEIGVSIYDEIRLRVQERVRVASSE